MKSNRLEKIMAGGKTRYVLLHGVLGWGWLTAALVTGWSLYTKETVSTSHIAITFLFFSIGGVCWGLSTWWVLQKKHRAAQETQTAP